MTAVWIVQPHGVYPKPAIAVCTTQERAEAAMAYAERYNDGYHDLEVLRVELDRWYLPGLAVLQNTSLRANPQGRTWVDLPEDSADIGEAWA